MRNVRFLSGLAFAIGLITQPSLVHGQGRVLSISDLPSVTWAKDGLTELYWGMPAQEVQSVLRVGLRLDFEYSSGGQRYICDFRPDWMGSTLFLNPLVANRFEFWRGRLIRISLSARRQDANDLLLTLFREFGPARHDESLNINSGSGVLRKSPFVRYVPLVYSELKPEPKDHIYQWIDNETEVTVRDSYTWDGNIKANVRTVTVDFEGWAYCSSNLPAEASEGVREKGRDYLDWLNRWHTMRGTQAGSILGSGSSCLFCNRTRKCHDCDGKGLREYEVSEAGPMYGPITTKRFKCESCNGTGICVYCESKVGLQTREKVDCPECAGRGRIWVPEQQVACPACNGTGKIRWRSGFYHKCQPPIGACGGTGKITKAAHWEECQRCSGSGKVLSD